MIINHLQIHYVTAGSGEPMIFLHGFPSMWCSWKFQIEYFSERHTVIAPDLRGYGQSQKTWNLLRYDISKIADDIVELIAHLELKQVILVGHDFGGGVAWYLGLFRPDLVKRLIILSFPYPAEIFPAMLLRPRQFWRSIYMTLAHLPILPELFLKKHRHALFTQLPNASPEIVERHLRHNAHFLDFFGMVGGYRMAIWHFLYYVFHRPKLKVPLLLIFGERDWALDAALFYRSERYTAAGCELLPVPKSGHWLQLQRPDLINQAIENFIKNGD